MTFKYNNVYINDVATVAGKMESEGPLVTYFDKVYKDFYMGSKTWEQAEIKMITECVDILLNKINKKKEDINVFIAGDLLNQIAASSYAAKTLNIPYMGIYGACASSTLGLIIASNMIEGNMINNAIVNVSSHNNASEKQFRYPVEYGGPKRLTTTFTTTGSAASFLSYNKNGIKLESATLGSACDSHMTDPYHMGGVMAIACAKTIVTHLEETKREIDYYDLVLTGDLGMYGKKILKEVLEKEYGITRGTIDDSACMIFDIDEQSVYAGGSGPACLPLVSYSYIFDEMKKGKLMRVLLVGTGALMNCNLVNQKLTIPSIAHAISLEVLA